MMLVTAHIADKVKEDFCSVQKAALGSRNNSVNTDETKCVILTERYSSLSPPARVKYVCIQSVHVCWVLHPSPSVSV